jgi:hypothetical protein
MPFDQFTIEQLAGDLLPNPTHEQLIATAFNRNNRYNSDYQLVDYFNDVAESGRARKEGNSEPWIKTPTPEQRARLAALQAQLKQAHAALKKAEPQIRAAQLKWEKDPAKKTPALQHELDFHFTFDGPDERIIAQKDGARIQSGVQGTAGEVTGAGYFEIGKIPGLIGNGRFSIAFWLKPGQVDAGPILSNETPGTTRNGILVEMEKGRLRWNINTRWIGGVSTIETQRTLSAGEWVHIVLSNDGTQRAAGMKIYINGEEQPVDVIRNTNSNLANRNVGTPMRIGYSKHVGHWRGHIDELRFYTTRTLSAAEATLLAVQETPDAIARLAESNRTPAQQRLLRLAFLEQGGTHCAQLEAVQHAKKALVAYQDSLPTTMIMRDLPEGRPSFVRLRGVYNALGERVQPGVPAVLPPLPAGVKNDRLALARWLVSPEHPLTARVTVNRHWQILFSRGFVNTPEDFGAQGALPTHPELLDWLAAEFVESGWDVKALMKRIVMSATYRQSSDMTAEHRQTDPDNVWLARAPRLRLPGNVLRDQALLVSGLLVEQQGGPSVFAYQPAGLWEEASNAKYTVGKGPDLYRRSLYTYWKRTLAPPSMALLDAGDREYCSVKPKHTNTPLQALTLMNETTYVEASRKLAERMLTKGGQTDPDRIDFAFRLVTSRAPTAAELEVLVSALAEYRREFEADPKAAASSLKVGASPIAKDLSPVELAAHAALANVLLNLDEVTTRE